MNEARENVPQIDGMRGSVVNDGRCTICYGISVSQDTLSSRNGKCVVSTKCHIGMECGETVCILYRLVWEQAGSRTWLCLARGGARRLD
jgi:hypothetical protein